MKTYECKSCGFETQDDIDEFELIIYSRTTADSDHGYCPICNHENIVISSDHFEYLSAMKNDTRHN